KNAPIEAYWNNSPLKDIANVKTPTIFFVGERDPRVPMPQSIEMHRALKSNGVPTHLYVAPREPHVWAELRHQLFKLNTEIAALLGLFDEVNRAPWVTQARTAREQPIQFSHERHVAGNGIDCRYCHTSVEESSFAGIPPTKTCMNCHSQIFANSPFLEPVRESFRSGRSIEWTRVHDLPDFVYFNHSIHVHKGIGCT